MKYLSSRQALADIAYFLTQLKTQENYTNSKVIVQGGSYSGAVAAWLRMQFPFVIDAALSSSGPVLA